MMGPLTGPSASIGLTMSHGVVLAAEQYNAAHPGCGVAEMNADTQGYPGSAPPIANFLVSRADVLGVVGPAFSGESLSSGSIFAQAGLPTISPSATNPSVTRHGWKTFHRVIVNDLADGPLLAKYIASKLGGTRVAVVADDSDYGRTIARAVRGPLGRRVVLNGSARTGQTNFSRLVRKVRAKHVKVVVFGGYYPEGGRFLRQLVKAHFTGKFVGSDGIMDRGLRRIAGANAVSHAVLASGVAPATLSPSFTAAYRAAFGSSPGSYALEAYDAAKVFLAGLNSGAATRPDMLSFVNHYNAPGLTKRIAFSSTGEPVHPPLWIYKPSGTGFAVKTKLQ